MSNLFPRNAHPRIHHVPMSGVLTMFMFSTEIIQESLLSKPTSSCLCDQALHENQPLDRAHWTNKEKSSLVYLLLCFTYQNDLSFSTVFDLKGRSACMRSKVSSCLLLCVSLCDRVERVQGLDSWYPVCVCVSRIAVLRRSNFSRLSKANTR